MGVTLAIVVAKLLGLLQLLIIVRVVFSWVSPDPGHPVARALDVVYEPLVGPIRDLIGPRMGGLDFSPLIALVLLSLLRRVVLGLAL